MVLPWIMLLENSFYAPEYEDAEEEGDLLS